MSHSRLPLGFVLRPWRDILGLLRPVIGQHGAKCFLLFTQESSIGFVDGLRGRPPWYVPRGDTLWFRSEGTLMDMLARRRPTHPGRSLSSLFSVRYTLIRFRRGAPNL